MVYRAPMATPRQRPEGGSPRRRLSGRVVVLAAFAGGLPCLPALVTCGGTTGKEANPGSTQTSDADIDAGVTVDATVDVTIDAGEDAADFFDTTIVYADRALPEGGGQPIQNEASAQQAIVMCAPDIPATYLLDGGVALVLDGASTANTEVPAVFTDAGEVLAPEGSPCVTQVWLGSADCDQCMRDQFGGGMGGPWMGEYGTAEMPPCSDLLNAGTAAVGLGAGQTRYQLCENLLDCLLTSHCATEEGLNGCICNLPTASTCVSNGGAGPCINQALAAAEITGGTPGDQFFQLSKQLGRINPGVGHAWGSISKLADDAIDSCQSSCPFTNAIPDGGAD
jgi:hypothetical protein